MWSLLATMRAGSASTSCTAGRIYTDWPLYGHWATDGIRKWSVPHLEMPQSTRIGRGFPRLRGIVTVRKAGWVTGPDELFCEWLRPRDAEALREVDAGLTQLGDGLFVL